MSTNAYDNFLIDLFSNNTTFLLGQEVSELLQKKYGVTPVYARKLIQRCVSKQYIKSSYPLTFGNGQYMYFNNNNYISKNIIMDICSKHRPPIYRLLKLLDINNGIISYYEGLKVTASPLDDTHTKSDTLNDILKSLIQLEIVDCEVKEGVKYIISSSVLSTLENDKLNDLINLHRTKMSLDCIFLKDIKNWLIKHNIIDNERVIYRNKNAPSKGAEHNNFVWDAFAYTKTTGLNTIHAKNKNVNDKSTLVVLDVVINREYSNHDLQGFYNRVQSVRCSTKTGERKILPIVFYQSISEEALNHIRALGFMFFNLGSIYGEKIYDIISKLENIKLEEIVLSNPEKIVENVSSVLGTIRDTGQETNLENMKGDLFEALMYPLVKFLYPNAEPEQGIKLKMENDDGKPEYYEYDIIVKDYHSKELIIFELKAYKPSFKMQWGNKDTKNTLAWFFRRTLHFAREKYKHYIDYEAFSLRGCYITTAKFSDEALEKLQKINSGKLKPSKLDVYYDGDSLLQLLRSNNFKNIIDVLEKYFVS